MVGAAGYGHVDKDQSGGSTVLGLAALLLVANHSEHRPHEVIAECVRLHPQMWSGRIRPNPAGTQRRRLGLQTTASASSIAARIV